MNNTRNRPKYLVLASALMGLLVLLSEYSAFGQIAGGSALNLNGPDGYVSATLNSPPTNNWTISAWIYLRSGGDVSDPRVAILSSVVCGATTEFLIRQKTVGGPQYLEVARCGHSYDVLSVYPVPLNTWVQVTAQMIYDSTTSSNIVILYTNGVYVGGAYLPPSTDLSLGSNLAFGYNNNSYRKFDGYLDEVQIWSPPVAPVTTHVLNGAEANLIAYYRFDEGSGTVAGNIAYATNASSAALQGAAAWTAIPAAPFPAGTPLPSSDWVAQGPAYLRDNDANGGNSGAWGITPDYPVTGSVYAAAPHPTDPNVFYAAGPNGGIWKTVNATDPSPNWIPLTDQQPSLSMSCLEFDPTDPTHQTLIAGFGSYSSADQLGRPSGPLLGLLRTTDGGVNWQRIWPTNANGVPIAAVVARSNILLAASGHYGSSPQPGLWRSTNWGVSWNYDVFDLPSDVYSLVGVRGNNSRLYMASKHGILRSDDTGATWVPVLNGITNATTGCGPNTQRVLLAVHNNAGVEVVYAAVLNAPSYSPYYYFSTNSGGAWTLIGQKGTASFTHFSFAADPTDSSLAYMGGNGALEVWRINRANLANPFTNLLGFKMTITNSGTIFTNRSVHVDSHAITFDASGNLIETDDGGIYLLPRLAATSGSNGLTPNLLDGWRSLIGNLQLGEFWDISYDPLTKVLFGGTQDNGMIDQRISGNRVWDMLYGGDTFKVVMDARSQPGTSIRYLTGSYIAPGSLSRCIYGPNARLASYTQPTLSILPGGTFVPLSFTLEINAIDPRRLILCDANTLFETTDQGATLRNALLPHTDRFYVYRLSRMVYGGYLNGIPNPDVIWACGQNFPAGNYSIVLRTNAANPAQFLGTLTTNEPIGIVANSTNWRQAYYITAGSIVQTLNAGQTWSDITANLTGGPAVRTLEFLPLPSGDALAVGTDDGVYITRLAYLPRWWTRLGSSLPRAIANSLHYDPSDQLLALGTQGRGAWTYSLATWPQNVGPGSAVDVSAVAGNYIIDRNVGSPPNYTIAAWINLRSGGQTFNPRVAILSSTNCGGNPEFLIRSATTNANDPQYLELARCGSFNGFLSTNPVPLYQWVHVAVTVGATVGGLSNLVSYYVNGVPSGAFWYVNQDLTFVGNMAIAFNDGSNRKFDGLIDQVSFWQTALTPGQIPLIMAKQPTGIPSVDTAQILSLNFDEGTGTNTLGGNNGSLFGSARWVPSGALFQTLSDVEARPAQNITATNATLEASFAPQALPATLQFQYGTNTSYGSVVQQLITPRITPTLDGVTNFIAPSQYEPFAPQYFSVSLWFKTTSQQGGRLIGFGDSRTNASGGRDRHLYLGTDGLVRFGVFSTVPRVIMGKKPCNDGRWHHVAGTFSQDDGMRLYLDGVEVANFLGFGNAYSYGGYWRIGWDTIADWPGGSPSGYFAGAIAEVQIWNIALTPQFIAGNYRCQLSGTEPGLVTYYPLDQGPVTTVLDSAPANGANNGTVFGNPTWAPTLDLPGCFSQSVTNLQPATTYHFRAVAITPVETNYSTDLTFPTAYPPPVITSATNTTFTVGSLGSFQVTATGTPPPGINQSGPLPSGVSFNSGTRILSGTPAAGTGGTYLMTFTATNSAGTYVQNFTLTVNQPPLITSATNTTFTVGSLGSFQVTATGFPPPGINQSAPLPNGVGFNPGTGLLAGTPATGAGGAYPITFTATNAVGTNAKTFTLTVQESPTLGCPPNITTNLPGLCPPTIPFSATITNGYPPPTVTYKLGTNLITSPYAFPPGTNTVTVTATNGVSPDKNCSFTVTVLAGTNQPALNIFLSGTNAVLSWTNLFPCYTLQLANSLAGPNNWTNYTGTLATNGNRFYVTNELGSNRFFRLKY